MPRTITTENPTKDVCRYLKHWGNAGFVEDELHRRHTGLTPEKRRRKARTAALSILQGLEYLDSAADASLLTRPLPLFYAVENIAKAVCIVKDPALEGTDFLAHGLRGDKSRRYSIKNLECAVAPRGSDVWSRWFRIANADTLRIELVRDGIAVVSDDRQHYATRPLAVGRTLALGELLRHLPELAHDIVLAGWGHSYVVPVTAFSFQVNSGPPPANSLRFTLSHGHHAPTKTMIVGRESDLLKKYARTQDTLDVLEYRLAPTPDSISTPDVRLDVFGRLYMDFARGAVVLGEPVIYLAALFILADVVRYQVDQWNRLLADHPAEAILVERFLDLVPRKFPNLVLNELHGEFYSFKLAE